MPTSPVAGWNTKIYESAASISTVGAGCTALADLPGPLKRYQITTAANRIIDPRQPVTVYENGVAKPASRFTTITANAGIIVFAAGVVPTAPITIDYYRVPRALATLAKMASVSGKRTILDSSVFLQNFKGKFPGLKEMSGEIKTLLPSDQIYDGGTGKQITDLVNGTERLIEFDPSGTGANVFRFWALLGAISDSSDKDSLVEDGLTFESHSISAPGYVVDGSPYIGAP